MIDALIPIFTTFLPFLVIVTAIIATLILVNSFLKKKWQNQQDTRFRFQFTMLILTALGILIIIIALPVSETLRGQLLSLVGIVLSAAIALSSTTFIGNMLAGIMLRTIGNARPGDFITVVDITGRMTELGLLHTEIQTEDSDLVTVPNLIIATNPLKVVRSSGTIVSAEVSLGYDCPNSRVSQLLCDAAEEAGLHESFVQIRDLGDFSVVYRVAGVLHDVTSLLSARSNLRKSVLNTLHAARIEIVSPNFINSRSLAADQKCIPINSERAPKNHEISVEELAFEKADSAALAERIRVEIETIETRIKSLSDNDAKEKIELQNTQSELRKELAAAEAHKKSSDL